MTGPIIPAELWPEDAHLHTWDSNGLGNWLRPSYGAWHLWATDIPLPPGHDWRVPVMRPTAKHGEPVAWMRRCATYKAGDGRAEGERIVSEAKVYEDDLPLYAAPKLAIDLEQFRPALEHARLSIMSAEKREEIERLLALIDGQKAAPRGHDQPDLCDLCRVRDEVRTDAEGIPFCQECWDGWQASEQPTKGEGEKR